MALRKARILSSENDASMRNNQHQTTNVNIKLPELKKDQTTSPIIQSREVLLTGEDYKSTSQSTNDNLTQGLPTYGPTDLSHGVAYPAPESINPYTITELQEQLNNIQQREISLTENIEDLEIKNKFLELLLEVYQENPVKLNSYIICKSSMLMEMIKLLTGCDKVDLVLDDDIACSGCITKNKYIYVSKILITKNDKTEDLKYAYNDIYSKFIQHGISLKIVI